MVALNPPDESVGQLSNNPPSKPIATVFEGAYPVPVIVTEVPPLPVPVDKVIEGVTVKVASTNPPMLSVALTLCALGEEGGILKDAVKLPRPSLVTMAGVVDTGEPSYVSMMLLDAR